MGRPGLAAGSPSARVALMCSTEHSVVRPARRRDSPTDRRDRLSSSTGRTVRIDVSPVRRRSQLPAPAAPSVSGNALHRHRLSLTQQPWTRGCAVTRCWRRRTTPCAGQQAVAPPVQSRRRRTAHRLCKFTRGDGRGPGCGRRRQSSATTCRHRAATPALVIEKISSCGSMGHLPVRRCAVCGRPMRRIRAARGSVAWRAARPQPAVVVGDLATYWKMLAATSMPGNGRERNTSTGSDW